jgi:hypothetical protein
VPRRLRLCLVQWRSIERLSRVQKKLAPISIEPTPVMDFLVSQRIDNQISLAGV